MTKHSPFRYFKTSPEIIRLAVMLYVWFPLSLRNVEDLLHVGGIDSGITRFATVSASAPLNKWLKAHVSGDVVVHSLRHAMRDRLRAVECPADIIDQIGGWSRKGVGESYGRGYQVEQLWGWLAEGCGIAWRRESQSSLVVCCFGALH